MYYLTKKGKGFFSLSLYKGQKKQNKREGFGIQFFPNGCVYLGNWQNNKAQGKGLFLIKDGTSYKGEFHKNTIQSGKLTYFNGASFEGNFDSTPFERFKNGTFTFKSGLRYIGEWKEGLPLRGTLFDQNQKIGELPREQEIIYNPGNTGVFISSVNKWLYEGGLENNECNGDGIVYCTFQQYKMGRFKSNKTDGGYYKMSINWGEITEGTCSMDTKVGKIKKMFNNGYNVEYEAGGKKAVVTFPYLNCDRFEGSIKFDRNSFSVILRKGVYTFTNGYKSVPIDVYNVSDIFSIKEVGSKGVDFEFLLEKFIGNKKLIVKLKEYIKELYKDNDLVDVSGMPEFLEIKKKDIGSKKSSQRKLSTKEMDKFIRAKYRSDIKKKSIISRAKTPNLKKKPPKMFLKRKTKEYDQNKSIFPNQKLNQSNDSLKPEKRPSSRKSIQRLKNYESTKLKKSSRKIRKSGSLKKSTRNYLQNSQYNLEKSGVSSQNYSSVMKSNRNNKFDDLKESIVIPKKQKKLIKTTQNYYTPINIKNFNFNIIEEGIDYFEGRIIDGLKQGKGKMVYRNGTVFEGNFKNNNFEKDGKITFPNGIIYKGKFNKNVFNGPGFVILGRREIKGSFKNGVFESHLVWVNNQNLHFVFESNLEKNNRTGNVLIYFNNRFRISTRLKDCIIDEGKCMVEDNFGNFWNGDIYKKNNLIIFKSRKLKQNYFILDFLKGIIEVVSN